MGAEMSIITVSAAMFFIAGMILMTLHEMWADNRDKKWRDYIEQKAIPKIGQEITNAIDWELNEIPKKLKDIRKEMEE